MIIVRDRDFFVFFGISKTSENTITVPVNSKVPDNLSRCPKTKLKQILCEMKIIHTDLHSKYPSIIIINIDVFFAYFPGSDSGSHEKDQ